MKITLTPNQLCQAVSIALHQTGNPLGLVLSTRQSVKKVTFRSGSDHVPLRADMVEVEIEEWVPPKDPLDTV